MQFQLISIILCRAKVKFVMRNNYKIFVVKISINSWMTSFAGLVEFGHLRNYSIYMQSDSQECSMIYWNFIGKCIRMGGMERLPFTTELNTIFPHVETPLHVSVIVDMGNHSMTLNSVLSSRLPEGSFAKFNQNMSLM